jgi:hypothetical protein
MLEAVRGVRVEELSLLNLILALPWVIRDYINEWMKGGCEVQNAGFGILRGNPAHRAHWADIQVFGGNFGHSTEVRNGAQNWRTAELW